jgi:hypothetical protein
MWNQVHPNGGVWGKASAGCGLFRDACVSTKINNKLLLFLVNLSEQGVRGR